MQPKSASRNTPLEIASRQDLAQTLRNPDAAVRTAVLQSINKMIDKAAASGKTPSQEVADELYLRYQELEGRSERTWYTFLLLRLDGPPSLEVAKREFLTTDNDKILLLAAAQVARLPAKERVAFLSPCVTDPANPMRCRAAANMLDDCLEHLDPAVALRAAIISDHELPLPSLTADSLDAWLGELAGPYPSSARKALIQLGGDALEGMLALWGRLPDPVRIWVLRTGVERSVPGLAATIRETIRRNEGIELLQVALASLEALAIADEALVAPLYTHAVPSVRAAAIAAGNAIVDWSVELFAEESNEVRLAIIGRIGRSGRAEDVPCLLRLLEDPHWRIRARATDALVALAPASLLPLRKTLGNSDERVRVAAAQGLYRLGKEAWVRRELVAAAHAVSR